MGVRASRYFPYTSTGIFRNSDSQRCCNTVTNYQSPCSSRYIIIPMVHVYYTGTIIHTDEWRAYRQLSAQPNVASHSTVNHSQNFVAPNGVHTQQVTRTGQKKRMRGCHTHQVPSYLDEFMWRERYGPTSNAAWTNVLAHIAEQYPV